MGAGQGGQEGESVKRAARSEVLMGLRKVRPISLAVPWNMGAYEACNGFHPLYRALFEGEPSLTFNVVDDFALNAYLGKNPGARRSVFGAIEATGPQYTAFEQGDRTGEELFKHCGRTDIWMAGQIPGDLEFHHTSPFISGTRPFIFACESFLPIFMPFAYQGRGFLRSPGQLQRFYELIFSSRRCLGIISHIPETLEQISLFFRNAEIDKKLRPSRTGLGGHVFEIVTQKNNKRPGRPTFLFTSSANQNITSFGLRGGFVALRFAERYLRTGLEGRFVFRATRPSDEGLRTAGVDLDYIRSQENNNILWIERFLEERDQLRLFSSADILLLPSLNLHTVSIMQGMAAGAVPVVTDTYGPDHLVENDKTGIVLNGVRRAVWVEDAETGIPVDTQRDLENITEKLVEQMAARLIPLVCNREKLLDMQDRCRATARTRFDGAAFRAEFEENVDRAWGTYQAEHRRSPLCLRKQGIFESGALLLNREAQLSLFEGTPRNVPSIETAHSRVFRIRNMYIAVQRGKGVGRLGGASVLSLWKNEDLLHGRCRIGKSLPELHGVLYPEAGLAWRARLEEWGYTRLRRYPRLYRPAKAAYLAMYGVARLVATPPETIRRKSFIDRIYETAAGDICTPSVQPSAARALYVVREWRSWAMERGGSARLAVLVLRVPLVLVRGVYWGYLNSNFAARRMKLSGKRSTSHDANE